MQFLGGCRHARWCANDRIWSDSAENCGSAGAVHRRFGRPCDYAAMVSRNWCLRFSSSPESADTSVATETSTLSAWGVDEGFGGFSTFFALLQVVWS